MNFGPMHGLHHKFMGTSGRHSMMPTFFQEYPIKDYPEAEQNCKADVDAEIEVLTTGSFSTVSTGAVRFRGPSFFLGCRPPRSNGSHGSGVE